MRTVSEREWRDDLDAVLNAVAAESTYRIIRNGVEVAKIGPGGGNRGQTAEELVARHRRLPRIDYAAVRREVDEFFGTEASTPTTIRGSDARANAIERVRLSEYQTFLVPITACREGWKRTRGRRGSPGRHWSGSGGGWRTPRPWPATSSG